MKSLFVVKSLRIFVLCLQMIKAVLSNLTTRPVDLFNCRLVCHTLKLQVDDMLENSIISLWSWDPHFHGVDKPPYKRALRRPLPTGPVFQTTAQLNQYIVAMEEHQAQGANPFPNRSVYFRRVRSNNSVAKHLKSQLSRYTSVKAKTDHWGSTDEKSLLSLGSTYQLLSRFGHHLTSLIFESGATVTLPSIVSFHSLLHNLPHLRCLMFRTTWIDMTNPIPGLDQENIVLPPLPHLESLKICYCDRFITESLLRNYGGGGGGPDAPKSMVTRLHVIARDICWINYWKDVVCNNLSDAFCHLREFKLGYISTHQSFNLLEKTLRLTNWPLERLSLQFCGINVNFEVPTDRLFKLMNVFPKLKEFYLDVLDCHVSSLSNLNVDEVAALGIDCAGLLRFSIPAYFLRSAWLLKLIKENMRCLQTLQFLQIDRWLLWVSELQRAAEQQAASSNALGGGGGNVDPELIRPGIVEFRSLMETFWLHLPALRRITVLPADDNQDFMGLIAIDAVHEQMMSVHKLKKLRGAMHSVQPQPFQL